MSAYKRVQQWATFARVWHIYDAKWQNPFDSAALITKYLKGLHKPIFHDASNCGDHVVVINCNHIALPGEEWKRRVYFHHTGFPGGASWTLAWELHKKDPTFIIERAVYKNLRHNYMRRHRMQLLHLYAEDQVPDEILGNVSSQIPQLRPVPRTLDSYSQKEIQEFPKIEDFKSDYILEN